MQRASALALIGLALLVGAALAERDAAAATRLALVDGSEAAQLHQALQVALQPWAIEVVDWPWPSEAAVDGADPARSPPPLDSAALASNANARYVVWYDAGGKELVVHDAALRRDERRELAALPADELEASAVALSIKTMLRLQPPVTANPAASGWAPWLRVGPRLGLDGDGGAELRAQLGIEVALAALAGVRLGLLGEVGTTTTVEGAGGFLGDWTEWSAMATVGRDVRLAPWTLTAQVAVGLSRATLEGEDNRGALSEGGNHVAGLLTLGGGRPVGPFLLGAVAGLAARGSERYLRENGQTLWEEPSLLLSVMALARLSL